MARSWKEVGEEWAKRYEEKIGSNAVYVHRVIVNLLKKYKEGE